VLLSVVPNQTATNSTQSHETIAYRTQLDESIDRYFRPIEQSPGLWLNLNIEFQTPVVGSEQKDTDSLNVAKMMSG
jgi:hypothetical protein